MTCKGKKAKKDLEKVANFAKIAKVPRRMAKKNGKQKIAKVTRILEATVQNLYDLNQNTSVVVRKKFQLRCKNDLHRK